MYEYFEIFLGRMMMCRGAADVLGATFRLMANGSKVLKIYAEEDDNLMKKYYVLDTNILLQSPGAIYGFEDNTVVITGTTLQELDSKKNLDGEIGYNARQTARILEDIRNRGNLIKGVKLKETDGKLIFEPNEVSQEKLPEGVDIKKPDKRIIRS